MAVEWLLGLPPMTMASRIGSYVTDKRSVEPSTMKIVAALLLAIIRMNDKRGHGAMWTWSNYRTDALWMVRKFTKEEWRACYGGYLHWPWMVFAFHSQHNARIEICGMMEGSRTWKRRQRLKLWCAYHGVDHQSADYSYPDVESEAFELAGEFFLVVWCIKGKLLRHGKCMDDTAAEKKVTPQQRHVYAGVHLNGDNAFMELPDCAKLKGLMGDFLRYYQRLAQSADELVECLWSLPPKTHWLWHWADQAQWHNPRVGACMVDEDFVGA